MKTLFFIYYEMAIGGIEQKIIDMTTYLHEKRPDIRVIVIVKNKPPFESREKELLDQGAQICRYYLSPLVHFKFCFPLYVLFLYFKYTPDAVFSFSFIPSISAILAKIMTGSYTKTVIDIDGSLKEYELNQPYANIRVALMKYFYPFADAIIVVNNAIKKELLKIIGAAQVPIYTLPNWTYTTHIKHTHTKTHQYDVLYIGRLDKIKQINMLLEIMIMVKKKKPKIKLCLVGDGSEMKNLKRFAQKNNLGNNIIFTGYVHNPKQYFLQSKVFVYPSRNEGMSFSLLEAMAYGLPVVCNDFPSVRDCVKENVNGYIYRTVSDAASYILRLIDSKQLRKRMGNRGRQIVLSKFSEKNIKSYIRLLGI